MKPFNLEKFLAGELAITRDGRKVIDWHYFKDANIYKIAFTVERDSDLYTATSEGRCAASGGKSQFDLFMEEKEVVDGFYTKNIYFSPSGDSLMIFRNNEWVHYHKNPLALIK
jgi:hypothetical protein